MYNINITKGSFLNALLYMWGIEDNPAEEKAKEIIVKSHSAKIKDDLRKVNSDFRKSYLRMRNQSMAVCE